MFSIKEKDNMLRKIINGNVNAGHYTYKSCNIKEKEIMIELNNEGYIRLHHTKDGSFGYATDAGKIFMNEKGGYKIQQFKKIAHLSIPYIVNMILAMIIAYFTAKISR